MNKLLFLFLVCIFSCYNAIAQDECPIKLLNIEKVKKKEYKMEFQISLLVDSITLRTENDTITFVSNDHGTIGLCTNRLKYIDFGITKHDWFLKVKSFTLTKITEKDVSFIIEYNKIDSKKLKQIGLE